MRRNFVLLLVLCVFGFCAWGCATPAPRVAMVIGNGSYQHARPLTNPPRDATEIARRLETMGWAVSTAIDLPLGDFEKALATFEKQIKNADQAIFFYAGHSMQVNGENFIVPVEFEPSAAELERSLISLNRAIERFSTSDAQVAILLDASRDNPLAVAFGQLLERRGDAQSEDRFVGQGLAELPVSDGLYVAFATAPGHITIEGSTGSSPFSRALLKYIDLQDQDIRTLLVRVRNDVVESTGGSQVPWDYSSLRENFWIHPSSPVVNPASRN